MTYYYVYARTLYNYKFRCVHLSRYISGLLSFMWYVVPLYSVNSRELF